VFLSQGCTGGTVMTDGLRGTGGPATGDLVRDGVAIPVIHRSPARGPRLDLVIGIDAADDAAALESAEVRHL